MASNCMAISLLWQHACRIQLYVVVGLPHVKFELCATGTHARLNANTPPRASCLQHDRHAAQFRAVSAR
eukprot:7803702-Alexandrium_andersonii.AAC.1